MVIQKQTIHLRNKWHTPLSKNGTGPHGSGEQAIVGEFEHTNDRGLRGAAANYAKERVLDAGGGRKKK